MANSESCYICDIHSRNRQSLWSIHSRLFVGSTGAFRLHCITESNTRLLFWRPNRWDFPCCVFRFWRSPFHSLQDYSHNVIILCRNKQRPVQLPKSKTSRYIRSPTYFRITNNFQCFVRHISISYLRGARILHQ